MQQLKARKAKLELENFDLLAEIAAKEESLAAADPDLNFLNQMLAMTTLLW